MRERDQSFIRSASRLLSLIVGAQLLLLMQRARFHSPLPRVIKCPLNKKLNYLID